MELERLIAWRFGHEEGFTMGFGVVAVLAFLGRRNVGWNVTCRGEEIGQVLICMVGWLVVVVSWVGDGMDGMDGMGWSSQIVMP